MATEPPVQTGLPFTAQHTAAAGETLSPTRRPRSASTDMLAVAMRHTQALVDGLRGEMMGEIKALTRDVDRVTKSLENVPDIAAINKANRRAIYTIAALLIAAIALGWTVFGVGISLTSGVADHVVTIKEDQRAEHQRQEEILRSQRQILEQLKQNQGKSK